MSLLKIELFKKLENKRSWWWRRDVSEERMLSLGN
jgi:hypothetical protein